jgi:predicted lipoprotein with Yx(FWY)xxD motif
MELRNTSKVGTVLQANGRTLYFFGGDAPAGENTHPEAGAPRPTSPQANCTGSNCLRPFHAGSLSLGFGVSRLDFDEFDRGDGQKQSTYRGWPLYTADTDTAAGQLTADGQDKLWHAVAVPFYSVIIRRSIVTQRFRDASPTTYEYTYLADGSGMSLYMYWQDRPAVDGGQASSGCSGRCLVRWPPTHYGNLKFVSSLSASDFDSMRWTPDYEDAGPPVGEIEQLTYKGWPMYYWYEDFAPGSTTGHCVRRWSLAEIDGEFIDC